MKRQHDKQRMRSATVVGAFVLLLTANFSSLAVPPLPGRIDVLNAAVTSLSFFEKGQDLIPKNARQYKSRFPKATTRFIAWELNLEYPEQERDVPFDIVGVYYLDGQRFLTKTWHTYLSRGWTSSWHSQSIGAATPGALEPGKYKLELFVDGGKVATGRFEVVSAAGDAVKGKGTPSRDEQFPDDLGDL